MTGAHPGRPGPAGGEWSGAGGGTGSVGAAGADEPGAASLLARTSELLDGASAVLAALLMTALIAVMFTGVIYRYVLNDALPWTDEIAGFFMGWLVFLGSGIVYRRAGHPSITVLTRRLAGRGATIAAMFRETATGAYLCVLFGAGIQVLLEPQPHSPVLELSYRIAYLSVPVAAAVMLVHWARFLARDLPARRAACLIAAGMLIGTGLLAIMLVQPAWLANLPVSPFWILLPLLLVASVPVAMALGLCSSVLLAAANAVPPSIIVERAYAGIDNPSFLAIPAFMLTGSLMLATGLADDLIAFAASLVGRVRGGLALADVVASVLFADISGSAVADTAAIGTALMPGMVRRGYDAHFVAAHQAASGSLGTLFPPSISMIIFATVTSVSVSGLFLSSIVPGLLVAATYMGIAYVIARRRGYPREPARSIGVVLGTTLGAIPALVAPVVVLGGILFGVFTPYEAGAIAAVYVATVGLALRPRSVLAYGRAVVDGAGTAAMVMFIIANASILAWVMIGDQIPQSVAAYVASLTSQPSIILVLVSAVLIVLSVFLEPPAILIAVVPILLPIVTHVGTSPFHFGVIVMLTSAIGMLLPPIGITLLVSVAIIGTPMERAARAAVPYVIAGAVDALLVIFVPGLTRWLPDLVHFLH
jgi:tripartite ATP-independent transporter DctM subunit